MTKPGLSLVEKVCSRLPEDLPDNECWNVPGTGSNNRPVINHGGKCMLLSRVVFEMHHARPLQKGECVLHKCDNPECVNPANLFAGSQLDNIADRVAKGRNKSGPNTKYEGPGSRPRKPK